MSEAEQRLDIWLWRARFFKMRSDAAEAISKKGVRIDRTGMVRKVTKPGVTVCSGDVLSFRKGKDVITLRVVACNLEKGKYIRGSGSNTRTVSFSKPIQGVLLYKHKVETIPRKQPVENYFPGEVEFDAMFDGLYPPAQVSESHGLFVYWEVQLLVDELVDQELAGSVSGLEEEDFFDDGS